MLKLALLQYVEQTFAVIELTWGIKLDAGAKRPFEYCLNSGIFGSSSFSFPSAVAIEG